jgi:hypothetical protein
MSRGTNSGPGASQDPQGKPASPSERPSGSRDLGGDFYLKPSPPKSRSVSSSVFGPFGNNENNNNYKRTERDALEVYGWIYVGFISVGHQRFSRLLAWSHVQYSGYTSIFIIFLRTFFAGVHSWIDTLWLHSDYFSRLLIRLCFPPSSVHMTPNNDGAAIIPLPGIF